MIPLRIRGEKYRTFSSLDWPVPEGCCAIVGQVAGGGTVDSNGAGKSTLVNAIDVALFGPQGRSWEGFLTRGVEGTELMVELTFAHAGETYRARRGYSARGAGKSTLDLEQLLVIGNEHGEDVWDSRTLGNAKETQALLERTLGFTRATFRASSFMVQRDASAFTLAEASAQKKILHVALGLERYGLRREAVRRDLRAAQVEISRIDGRLEGVTREALDEQANDLRVNIAANVERHLGQRDRLAKWEGELETAALAVQAAKENAAATATMKTRVDAAATALASKGQLQRDAISAEEQAGVVRLALAELSQVVVTEKAEQLERDLVAQIETHRVEVAERNQTVSVYELRSTEKKTIYAQAEAAAKKAVELDEKISLLRRGSVDHCPTCEQELGVIARDATISSLRAQAQTAADERDALREGADAIELPAIPDEPVLPADVAVTLAAVRTQLTAARDAEVERAKLTERLAGYETVIAAATEREYLDELQAAQAQLHALLDESAKLTVVDVAPLEAAAITARGRVEQERTRLQTAEREKAVAEERLAQLTARAEQLDKDLGARETLTAEVDLLAILERAYGPDGIPSLILENVAIPYIETEMSRLLTLTGGPVTRVELRTDRANKDGSVRDDVFDLVCVTDTGDCTYADLSGGEQFRIDFTFRVAFAEFLKTRHGVASEVLVIDEPDGLDGSGKQALVEILHDLEARAAFRTILLISHDTDLRDSFAHSLVVVKDQDGRSRVDGQLAEAVAA